MKLSSTEFTGNLTTHSASLTAQRIQGSKGEEAAARKWRTFPSRPCAASQGSTEPAQLRWTRMPPSEIDAAERSEA